MATDHNDHDRDGRIAEAIRAMADDEGRLTSPPTNLWGRIERAIDDPAEMHTDLVPRPRPVGPHRGRCHADAVEPAGAPRIHRWGRTAAAAAAAVLVVAALAGAVVWIRALPGCDEHRAGRRAPLSGKGLDPGGSSTGSAELREDAWKVAIAAADLPKPPTRDLLRGLAPQRQGGPGQSLGPSTAPTGSRFPTAHHRRLPPGRCLHRADRWGPWSQLQERAARPSRNRLRIPPRRPTRFLALEAGASPNRDDGFRPPSARAVGDVAGFRAFRQNHQVSAGPRHA